MYYYDVCKYVFYNKLSLVYKFHQANNYKRYSLNLQLYIVQCNIDWWNHSLLRKKCHQKVFLKQYFQKAMLNFLCDLYSYIHIMLDFIILRRIVYKLVFRLFCKGPKQNYKSMHTIFLYSLLIKIGLLRAGWLWLAYKTITNVGSAQP